MRWTKGPWQKGNLKIEVRVGGKGSVSEEEGKLSEEEGKERAK